MKFKLPKALLVTLVSTLAANAAESDQYNYRPQAILDGTETAEVTRADDQTVAVIRLENVQAVQTD